MSQARNPFHLFRIRGNFNINLLFEKKKKIAIISITKQNRTLDYFTGRDDIVGIGAVNLDP